MRHFFVIMLLVCFCVLSSLAQGGRGTPGASPREGIRTDSPFPPPASSELLKHRYEQAKKLSGQLVQLVSEVDEELNKSGANILSVSTLKKLKQIEKLARKLRGRIKQ